MASSNQLANIDYSFVMENLGAGILIFNHKNELIFDNKAAQRMLGANLVMIRLQGWQAVAMLMDNNPGKLMTAAEIRSKAHKQEDPVRFSMLLGGSYTPCWLASFGNEAGQSFTQMVINIPDWSALTELMGTFRAEARTAINDTNGQAIFIRKLLQKPPAGMTAEKLGERAMGMLDLISTKMHRLQLLVDLLHRLEIIRTGQLAGLIENYHKQIDLEDFMEDFMETLYENPLVDPADSQEDYRKRLKLDMDDKLYVFAPRSFLENILRDVLRNAFIYSEKDKPVKLTITANSQGRLVQFDIIDQGCGIREKEFERVFEPFQRARQPQVMREHGYGLSLYLAKSEIEAMGGRMWFESTEGVGSTFSFKLPSHAEE